MMLMNAQQELVYVIRTVSIPLEVTHAAVTLGTLSTAMDSHVMTTMNAFLVMVVNISVSTTVVLTHVDATMALV